jgi:hypothetical protein
VSLISDEEGPRPVFCFGTRGSVLTGQTVSWSKAHLNKFLTLPLAGVPPLGVLPCGAGGSLALPINHKIGYVEALTGLGLPGRIWDNRAYQIEVVVGATTDQVFGTKYKQGSSIGS